MFNVQRFMQRGKLTGHSHRVIIPVISILVLINEVLNIFPGKPPITSRTDAICLDNSVSAPTPDRVDVNIEHPGNFAGAKEFVLLVIVSHGTASFDISNGLKELFK
jgi:hypothetical protein